MGKACSTHADEKCVQNLSEKLNGRDNLGDPVVDGRAVLTWISMNQGTGWIQFVQSRIQWQALVNMVIRAFRFLVCLSVFLLH
jgi:hypothetical protein